MIKKINKNQSISLMLLLGILNSNIVSMQKSDVIYNKKSQCQDSFLYKLNIELESLLNQFEDNRNDLKKAVELVLSGADVDKENEVGSTALMWAAWYGYKDIVQLFIDHGANVNKKDIVGDTVLMLAVIKGYEGIVQLLIDNGASVHEKNKAGNTALMLAAVCGYKNIVQLLIDNGASVHKSNYYGDTALAWAEKERYNDIVQLLIDNGSKAK